MGFRKALVVGLTTGLAVFAIAAVGCGDDDSVSPEEAEQQVQEAVQQQRERQKQQEQSEEIAGLKNQVAELTKQLEEQQESGAPATPAPPPASAGAIPADATSCGSGIYVNEDTSCPFAVNVLHAWLSVSGNTFTAHSPTTGEDYTMTCTPGSVVTCTGGNSAAVYIVL